MGSVPVQVGWTVEGTPFEWETWPGATTEHPGQHIDLQKWKKEMEAMKIPWKYHDNTMVIPWNPRTPTGFSMFFLQLPRFWQQTLEIKEIIDF